MKPLQTTFSLLLLLSLISCNPNRIFEEHSSSFPNYRWYEDKPIEFTVNVTDTISKHQVSVALRHVYGYSFPTMKIYMDVTTPSGKSRTKGYDLQVTGEDDYLSDCSGDICDLEVLIEEQVRFMEQGDWRFVIFCDMNQPYVPNVMEFGLIIDKYTSSD